ncbi:MAG: nucleoside monophosphate kinase [Patescibacteria group bacterium]|nr:nucleoside monophosphate kinase [Patescibacteria group bacterium]
MQDIRTFLMMGRPGAGKGTQAKLLAKKLGAEVYSSGNRLREMAKGHGFVARKIKDVIDSGGLLPSWLSSHLFEGALLMLEPEELVVFEGACRRLEEARAFDRVVAWLERPYKAVFINVSDEESEKRLNARRAVERRADDASDTVIERLAEYEENTRPAVEFLRERGVLVEIDGHKSVEDVHKAILSALRLQ